jgi:hypothetical protein
VLLPNYSHRKPTASPTAFTSICDLFTYSPIYNFVGCILIGIGSEMASSDLVLEEQEICPWVKTGLALEGQEEQ